MFGHVVHADEVATLSAEGARCEVEGGLSMTKLNFFFWILQFAMGGKRGPYVFFLVGVCKYVLFPCR